MGKIVLAIDASEYSLAAFHFYLENIHKDGNELLLVHAIEYPFIPEEAYMRVDVVTDLMDDARKGSRKVEEAFESLCKKHDIPCQTFADFSDPGEFVCKIAETHGALMVVMGTRGMGVIRRTIFGSVSDYVMHHAHCPVLITREEEKKVDGTLTSETFKI